jgi:hypothetical protein
MFDLMMALVMLVLLALIAVAMERAGTTGSAGNESPPAQNSMPRRAGMPAS